MMRTSAVLPAALFALLSTAVATAQEDGTPPPGVHMESVIIVGDGDGNTVEWSSSSSGDRYEDLDLSEAQRGKIDGIRAEADKAVKARVAEAHEKGDWVSMATDLAKIRTDADAKVQAELTPAQREKYKQRAANRAPVKAMGGIGPMIRRLERDGALRRPSPASRVERVMKDLKIADAAEAEAIKALVGTIAKHQDEIGKLERSNREKTDGLLKSDGLKDEALAERLKAFRAERTKLEGSLRAAQSELLQVVSVRQEGVLFRHGILR